MDVDFTGVSAVRIPEGNVTKITVKDTGVVKWEKILGTPIGDLAIGSSVWFNVSGTLCEWIIVHQGNPDSSKYDSGANGTWLLMKNTNGVAVLWGDSTVGGYAASGWYTYYTTTFISGVQDNILQKIHNTAPPCPNTATAKFFNLSVKEIGGSTLNGGYSTDGVTLEYFLGINNNNSNELRVSGNSSIDKKEWMSRTVKTNSTTDVYRVSYAGSIDQKKLPWGAYARPACVMDSDTLADGNGNIIV